MLLDKRVTVLNICIGSCREALPRARCPSDLGFSPSAVSGLLHAHAPYALPALGAPRSPPVLGRNLMEDGPVCTGTTTHPGGRHGCRAAGLCWWHLWCRCSRVGGSGPEAGQGSDLQQLPAGLQLPQVPHPPQTVPPAREQAFGYMGTRWELCFQITTRPSAGLRNPSVLSGLLPGEGVRASAVSTGLVLGPLPWARGKQRGCNGCRLYARDWSQVPSRLWAPGSQELGECWKEKLIPSVEVDGGPAGGVQRRGTVGTDWARCRGDLGTLAWQMELRFG